MLFFVKEIDHNETTLTHSLLASSLLVWPTLICTFLVKVARHTGALVALSPHSEKVLGSNMPVDWGLSVQSSHALLMPAWVSSRRSGFLQ